MDEQQAATNAEIKQLLINFDRRFDTLDDRLDSIESQIVSFAGELAAARMARADNKKKSRRWQRGYRGYSLPLKSSGNASAD